MGNQAIAYKNKEGKITPLNGWSLLLPTEEEEKKESVLIDVVSLKEDLPTKGVVAFESEETKELGLNVGDVVGFKENRDYRINIDGKEYYRTRLMDLMYVEEPIES